MKYEQITLTNTVRENLPGKFIKLSKGYTHYELLEANGPNADGPKGSDLVVLVHGFSSPMFVWDKVAPFLKKNGFNVLRYDLYGRGFSDRPNYTYDKDIYDSQLINLLSALGYEDTSFHLVGLSMGGEISTIFTSRHPEKIKTLTLVDPAGLPTDLSTPPNFVLKIPFVKYIINRIMIGNLDKNFYRPENFPEYEQKYTAQMQYKGFRDAIKSSLLHMDMQGASEEFKKAGNTQIPKLLFWGENDETIPYEVHEKVQEKMKDLKFVSVPECGHMPNYEQPNIFNNALLEFLQTHSKQKQ